ncbi:hypothetical protein IX51_07965 [uncultured archaeon]|nr:hypothetical protein IX51_07965 [uncultured archaeon]
MRIGKKYNMLLEDPDIRRWYDNLKRGSQSTADVRLRGLGRFCTHYDTTPKDFLNKSEKEMSDLMMDYVSDLEKDGKAPAYIDSCLKLVRSWLKYNSIVLTRSIKIKNAKIPTTLNGQRTPSQDQLKKILQAGTMTSRVCISLVSQSGIRLEVLGDYSGKDGLRLKDFPELVIEKDSVDFETIPARIVIRNALSKAGHEYFTFIGPEGAEYIKDYLNERMRKGEKLTPETPLVIPRNHGIHFISTINIGDQIRTAIRKAGFPWRPYDLRHYFATQTMEAESKGAIIRDWRVFFMGHKGDIEHQYTLNNRTLSKDRIESMRESYSNALKFLETEKKGISEEDHANILREHSIRTYAMITGSELSDDERERLMSLEDSDFWKEISEKYKQNKKDTLNNGHSQKVVSVKVVREYINQGWEYVNTLPGNKEVIVKLP